MCIKVPIIHCEICTAGKRSNKNKKEVQADEVEALVEATDEGANVTVTKKKSRAKAVNKGPVFGESFLFSLLTVSIKLLHSHS